MQQLLLEIAAVIHVTLANSTHDAFSGLSKCATYVVDT